MKEQSGYSCVGRRWGQEDNCVAAVLGTSCVDSGRKGGAVVGLAATWFISSEDPTLLRSFVRVGGGLRTDPNLMRTLDPVGSRAAKILELL